MYYMFPGPTRLGIPNCLLIGSAVFVQFTAELSRYTLQCALKRN